MLWSVWVLAQVILADQAPASAPKTVSVTVPAFGTVDIADNTVEFMQRGTGAGRVQLLIVPLSPPLKALKRSWADDDALPNDVREEPVVFTQGDRARLRRASEQLWKLAPKGTRTFAHPSEATDFQWAIVQRRGTSIRVIDGGPMAGDEPEELQNLLEFTLDLLAMQF